MELDKDSFIETKVYVTRNYQKFKFLPNNRPIKGNIVGNSITKKNLLVDNPILVTPDMEVLDGQNRLAFAREQNIPIYYKIAQVTKVDDIVLLQNQKPWQLKDHQNFHKDNANYKFVQEMEDKYGLSIYFIVECCDPKQGSSQRFKDGAFSIKVDKQILEEKFAELHELLEAARFVISVSGNKSIWVQHKFQRTLWSFINRQDYEHKRLLHSFKLNQENLRDILTLNSDPIIYEAIENKLYNYRRKPREKKYS